MRIRIVALLASALLLSHAHAADQLIKPIKPGDLAGASQGKIVPAPATAPAAPVAPVAPLTSVVPVAGTADVVPIATATPPAKETLAAKDAAGKRPATGSDDEEQNIQLLAERISARLAALRQSNDAIKPASSRKKSDPALARAAHAAAPASQARHHWHYEGENGPGQWGKLNPAWAACDKGERQSPIDIRDGIRVDLEPVGFNYQPARFNVVDNGHTVQVNVGTGNTMTITGRSYELTQFHFHLPSEERINGKGFPMVLHLVHKDMSGRLAVVAVLVEEGTPHELVQQVWNNLPLEKNDPVVASMNMELGKLLPTRREYYTYMGSLTTPPCSEGVLWIVLKQPIQVSSQQISIFARLYPMNARPIQAQAGRLIKESN